MTLSERSAQEHEKELGADRLQSEVGDRTQCLVAFTYHYCVSASAVILLLFVLCFLMIETPLRILQSDLNLSDAPNASAIATLCLKLQPSHPQEISILTALH